MSSICFYFGANAQRVQAGTLKPKACEGVNFSRDHVHVNQSTAAKLIESHRAMLQDGRLLQTPETSEKSA